MTPETTSDDRRADSATSEAQEEDVILRTTIPAGHIDQLHRRKVMTGAFIQDIVQEALAAHLDVADDGAPRPDGGADHAAATR